MSPTDTLQTTQAKMQEYLDNGVRLGWLIDPKAQQVEIYRPGRSPEVLSSPITLSGEDVLPGFTLDMAIVWSMLRIYLLQQNEYVETEQSQIFPTPRIQELPQLIEQHREQGRLALRRAVRAWVRQ